MWAEWYRALAELGEPPDLRLPRDLWRFSLTLQRVADLSRSSALGALGLLDSKPDRAQWPVFQDAGARLAADGFEGVLFCSSPSQGPVRVRVRDRRGVRGRAA